MSPRIYRKMFVASLLCFAICFLLFIGQGVFFLLSLTGWVAWTPHATFLLKIFVQNVAITYWITFLFDKLDDWGRRRAR